MTYGSIANYLKKNKEETVYHTTNTLGIASLVLFNNFKI